ncbi:solute carrier family 22 member 1-like isoform X2 [Achroia grisella]|uniref:solute carrier family 22 member 1-like isoform X2 n=1 Tax=Achroia grisella TaxID=688607 RepID=UPI0027D34F58|nr:solute carrier family 22 member 1-like isoform X2 [Achroia grisella]
MPRIKNIKLNNPIEKHFNVLTPYHYYFFSLIFLSKLPIFWHVLSLIFLSPPMDYYCNTTETNNISNDLKNVCPCKEPWWNRNVFTETVQTKFGLICESAWLISFSQSMLYMGTLFGALVFGFLSDKHCDEFQLALSIPVFLIVGFKWLIMESPKWLMDNDHIEQAAMVMEKLSKFNRTSGEIIKEEIEEFHSTHTSKNRRRMNFWHIFKHKRLVLNLGCMSIIYFTCGMGYYGVSQYIGKMSGDIHTNVAISGTLLLPGTITAIFLLKILNRRTFLMSTNLLSGIFMVIVICIPNHLAWVRVVFACICNCFFFMSFMIVFLCGVELFPTSIRNSVLGFLSVLSRLGQIVAPPINSLPELYSGITFGIMAILGAVLCYPLPETKNIELPSTLEDSRTLYRKAVNVGNQGKKISVEQ